MIRRRSGITIGVIWLVSIPLIGMGWITVLIPFAATGLLLIIFGLQDRKRIYVKAVRGESSTIYGPYKTLEEANEDTANLECDKKGAFKASSIKDAVRANPILVKGGGSDRV